MRRGFFLVFEGIDKCGKSTQISLLSRSFQKRGIPVLLTREPGGTPLGESVRKLLLDAKGKVCPEAELLLYEASRAQHVQDKIRPALRAGKVVLCDRFSLSTRAYQGAGRKIASGWVNQLDRFATGGLKPHLTLVIDIPVVESMKRIGNRPDRMEKRALLEKVRRAYRKLADGRKIVLIDGRGSVEAVHQRILKALGGRF